ncbi:MAG: hypothetical protein ACO37W_09900, partial [Prochlorotrichaceae cyanobacterium]
RAGEFALYDEYDPLRKIQLDITGKLWKSQAQGQAYEFVLNFNQEGPVRTSTTYGSVNSDGNDALFGDLGNDWLVGGTGQDNLYGGCGNDQLNAYDYHTTNGGLNIQPDTHPSYEDRAFGGAGRDILIGNTGGDRLIDWVGEFNSYLVPFAPFGMATVSRTMQPQLPEFLTALAMSDGMDITRAADEGSDPERYGEPFGELGIVRQKDFAWKDQTGAPSDPQAGNIPGGARDVLRSANFNTSGGSSTTTSFADGFAADSGRWQVDKGRLQVSPETLGEDAVSVFYVDQYLPSYYEVAATINAVKPTAGYKSNAFIIFDYQNPTNFKFAGINISTDKLEMGHRDADGWHVDVQVNAQIRPDQDYNVLLAVNGLTATLLVNNKDVLNHVFAPRVDADGYAYGLNAGMVGLGANNSSARIDNVRVQVLPPEKTLDVTEDFEDSQIASPLALQPVQGEWQTATNTTGDTAYTGTPTTGEAQAISLIGLGAELSASSYLELEAELNLSEPDGSAGFVFDYYSADDFKYVTFSAETNQIIIGHYTSRDGWVIDATYSIQIDANTNYDIGISLVGTTISVTLNGQKLFGYVFNSYLVDGDFGLLSLQGLSSFDDLRVMTNDSAFETV